METIKNNFDSKINKTNNNFDDGDDSLSVEQLDQILLNPFTVDILSQVLNDERKPVEDDVPSDLEVLNESIDDLIDLSDAKPLKAEELLIAQSLAFKQFELGLKNLEKQVKFAVQTSLADENLTNDPDAAQKLTLLAKQIDIDIVDLSKQDLVNAKDSKTLIGKLSDDISAFANLITLTQQSDIQPIQPKQNNSQTIGDKVDGSANLSEIISSLKADIKPHQTTNQNNYQIIGDEVDDSANLSEIISSLKADNQSNNIARQNNNQAVSNNTDTLAALIATLKIDTQPKQNAEQKNTAQNFIKKINQLDNLSELITLLNNNLTSNNANEQNNNSQNVIQTTDKLSVAAGGQGATSNLVTNNPVYQSCAAILNQVTDKIYGAYSALENDIINNNSFPEYSPVFNQLFEQINVQIDSFKDFTTKLEYRNEAEVDASALTKEKAASQKTMIRQAAEQALTNLGHTPESYTPITSLLEGENDRQEKGSYVSSGRQVGNTNYTNDLINELLTSNSSVSVLLICMIAFLAMTDIDSMVIKADALQITSNQKYSQLLTRTQSGLQALQSILPYMDKATNPPTEITDLYAICKIAYGTPGDPNLQRSLGPFADILNSVTDSSGNSYWSQIDFKTGNEDNNRKLLISAVDGMVEDANQALAHVGSPAMPQFKMSDDANKPGPLVDISSLNTMVKSLSDGTTAASSISQQANVVLQADNETLNQHIQAATTCLSVYKRINQSIWVQG